MIVYRLSKRIYANDLSGKGAEIAGGRWNSKGVAMLYTGESIALCVAEIAVHIPLGILPVDFCLTHIEIPDESIFELKNLPHNWNIFPYLNETQKVGDNFAKSGKFLAMKVPSAVVQGEFNYLIHPRHPLFSLVKILKVESFGFDERLFVR
ncbi:MAG: RES family NAD+ phosphorylase [Flavobacteriaceae bacterium]|jgi:RES domain-containing protein|nr:RES family NAD+ phosphorylase [Flavobacteriaceae bacterium]